jgi:DNA-binding response OmpR family regulator
MTDEHGLARPAEHDKEHVARLVPLAAGGAEPPSVVRARDVEVDLAAHLVKVGDRPVVLTALELRLAALLVANAGRVVTREELVRHGWGDAGAPKKAIEVYLSRIRRRIDPDPTRSTYIRTVRRVGYIFDL